MLQARAAESNDLWRELGIEIPRREGEPPRRRAVKLLGVRMVRHDRARSSQGSAPLTTADAGQRLFT